MSKDNTYFPKLIHFGSTIWILSLSNFVRLIFSLLSFLFVAFKGVFLKRELERAVLWKTSAGFFSKLRRFDLLYFELVINYHFLNYLCVEQCSLNSVGMLFKVFLYKTVQIQLFYLVLIITYIWYKWIDIYLINSSWYYTVCKIFIETF